MVPIYRLRVLLRSVVVFFKEYPDGGITRQQLADVMKVKVSSGGLTQKISDLKNFGLLEQKDGLFFLTDLAKRCVGSESDVQQKTAIEEAFKHVDLWKALWEKMGYQIILDNFLSEISEFTSTPVEQFRDKENDLLYSYVEDLSCFIPYNTITETVRAIPENRLYYANPSSRENNRAGKPSVEPVGSIEYPEYSKAPIVIKDALSFKIAEQLLQAMKLKLIQNGVNLDEGNK